MASSFFVVANMRYYFEKPSIYVPMHGTTYICDHPLYNSCTLFTIGSKGLAVIQQRFDPVTKHTWWGEIDPWLANALYFNPRFKSFFDERSGECSDGLYPTVSVRQIMWGLKLKPIKRERWETCFDRRLV